MVHIFYLTIGKHINIINTEEGRYDVQGGPSGGGVYKVQRAIL